MQFTLFSLQLVCQKPLLTKTIFKLRFRVLKWPSACHIITKASPLRPLLFALQTTLLNYYQTLYSIPKLLLKAASSKSQFTPSLEEFTMTCIVMFTSMFPDTCSCPQLTTISYTFLSLTVSLPGLSRTLLISILFCRVSVQRTTTDVFS